MTYVRGPKPGQRFPMAPLEALLIGADDWILEGNPSAHQDSGKTLARAVGDQIGASRSVVAGWRHRGLSVKQADVAAIAIGRHPAEIWPDFYDDIEAA